MSERDSAAGLEVRRRKLLFRAWHRGMRELDLILGRFAESAIAQLTDDELDELERLMEVPDCDLLAWVMGQSSVHPDYDTMLWRRLSAFNRAGTAAKSSVEFREE
jgi:antitoxin CptB